MEAALDSVYVEDYAESLSQPYVEYTEDGPIEVPASAQHAWLVSVVFTDGSRWHHRHRFPFTAEGEASAARLADRVLSSGRSLNPVHWSEGFPVYGSSAWKDQDAEERYAYQAARSAGAYIPDSNPYK